MSFPSKKTSTDFTFKNSGQPDGLGAANGGNFATVQGLLDARAIYNQDQINAILDEFDATTCAGNLNTTDGTTIQEELDSSKKLPNAVYSTFSLDFIDGETSSAIRPTTPGQSRVLADGDTYSFFASLGGVVTNRLYYWDGVEYHELNTCDKAYSLQTAYQIDRFVTYTIVNVSGAYLLTTDQLIQKQYVDDKVDALELTVSDLENQLIDLQIKSEPTLATIEWVEYNSTMYVTIVLPDNVLASSDVEFYLTSSLLSGNLTYVTSPASPIPLLLNARNGSNNGVGPIQSNEILIYKNYKIRRSNDGLSYYLQD